MFTDAEPGRFVVSLRKRLRHFELEFQMSVKSGEIAVIAGPSGSGKTTILKCIAGFSVPDSAYIALGNKVLTDTSKKIALKPQHRKTGLLNQDYSLFPHMTVLENIRYAHAGGSSPQELLELCGILHLAAEKPERISGGERQRCAVCRVLAMQPDMLLLDEPFSALDPENRFILQQLIRRISYERDIPVIHVTHDLAGAVCYADSLHAVNSGKKDDAWIDKQMKYLNSEITAVTVI